MKKEKKLLPIGSIVRLKGAKKKLMVAGFCVKAVDKNNELFDYVGLLYPVGMLTNDKQMVFNHDQIEEIVFMGYINIEEQDFKLQLYAEMEEKESSTEASTESNNN